MIDKTTAVQTVLNRLEKLECGDCLDMRTYKRNRSVLFVRNAPDRFLVIQNGFEVQRYENIPLGKMKKLIKLLLRKEFPRSTKIRLYALGRYDPSLHDELARKKI